MVCQIETRSIDTEYELTLEANREDSVGSSEAPLKGKPEGLAFSSVLEDLDFLPIVK